VVKTDRKKEQLPLCDESGFSTGTFGNDEIGGTLGNDGVGETFGNDMAGLSFAVIPERLCRESKLTRRAIERQ
jgi:hypothetical protein